MQVRCPQCQETFQAKGNARRIKCPSCGTREEAPEGGFGAAWAAGKPRTQFQPLSRPTSADAGGSSASPAVVWTLVAVVALLAIGGIWYFSQTGGDGTGTPPANTAPGTACGKAVSSFALEDPTNPVVEIDTDAGCMAAEIYLKKAPITAKNFIDYVNEGFYTNLHVYRIVPGFVNQMGGERDGQAGGHPAIKNEAITSGLHNVKYTLSMARTDAADSATTEFFINAADNIAGQTYNLDPCQPPVRCSSPDGYAVFGKLVHGMDVSDRINTMQAPPGPVLKSIKVVTGSGGTVTTSPGTTNPTTTGPACASAGTASMQADLITPGHWNVTAATDHMFVWAHNAGTGQQPYEFRVTGAQGAALPDGWAVTFAKASGCLQGDRGTSGNDGIDWAGTLATVTIPATQAAGDVPAELHAGAAMTPFVFHVKTPLGTVAKVGDSITTCYDLYGANGNRIQAGRFPLTVGSRAVTGYAYGVAGLDMGETHKLVVPPPYAYGASGNPPSIGPWEKLTWYATRVDSSATCPSFQG